MSLQSPFRLEINIISANDLPPVSKMLRTFVVAYIHPDEKLTTKIDHHGHTNPSWNYKVVFHVDEKFLKQESSVTIEIYNLAWLRDLPIGTARLQINNLSPPLNKNPNFRRVALRLCRPSGHLQGTLNLGVQLVDNAIPGEDMCLLRNVEQQIEEEEENDRNNEEEYNFHELEKIPETSVIPKIESLCASPESRYSTNIPQSEYETKTIATSCGSTMKPLPSDLAHDLKKGVYTDWPEYGSSIFENWTENGDSKSELERRQENVQWVNDDFIALKPDFNRARRKEKKAGLFSCFGNAYGFQFSIICGSNELKKKKNRNLIKQKGHQMTSPDGSIVRFHV